MSTDLSQLKPALSQAVLLADIVGSPRLNEVLGDARALELVASTRGELALVCERHGGEVIKAAEGELTCIFPDPSTAVRSATDMQLSVSQSARINQAPIAVRIGFQFGEVRRVDNEIFGGALSVAARVVSLAKGGQILSTDDTVDLLPAAIRATANLVDAFTLRGKADPVLIHEIAWNLDAHPAVTPAVDPPPVAVKTMPSPTPQPPEPASEPARPLPEPHVVEPAAHLHESNFPTRAVLRATLASKSRANDFLGEAREVEQLLQTLDKLAGVCRERGGEIVKAAANDLMCIFLQAADAAKAAIEMQQSVARSRANRLTPVAVHIGFYFGEVGHTVLGGEVDLADRLAHLAKDAQILSTGDTVSLLPPEMRAMTRQIDGSFFAEKEEKLLSLYELTWQEDNLKTTDLLPARDASQLSTAKLEQGSPSGPTSTHTHEQPHAHAQATAYERNLVRERDLLAPPEWLPEPIARRNSRYAQTMVLEYSGHRYAVDESHAILHIGRRKKGCELVLQNEKTSRMHATIEQRRDQFVLVDTSINGTFVQYEGEPERMVRHEELTLRASGTLSCGETHRANTAEVIRFYVT